MENLKYIKLYEQFLTEDAMDKFYATKMKNPKTGRKVAIKTILADPTNPAYKMANKIKDSYLKNVVGKGADQNKGDDSDDSEDKYDPYRADRIKDVEDKIKELNDQLYNAQADINDMNDQDEPDEGKLQDLEEREKELTAKLQKAKEELADLKK